MKKIFAGVVLPVVAAAAVIGSGFSIWFFGENEAKVDGTASVEVTNLLRIGKLEMKQGSKMILDQTEAVRTLLADNRKSNSEKLNNANSFNKDHSAAVNDKTGTNFVANGIYFSKETASDTFDGKIKYTHFVQVTDWDENQKFFDEITNVAKVEIVTRVTITDDLASYLDVVVGDDSKVSAVTTEEEKAAHTYAFKWADSVTEIGLPYLDGTLTAGAIKFNYANYAAQYSSIYTAASVERDADIDSTDAALDTAEPHNTKEYVQLVGAAKNAKVTIETIATIVEIA